MSTTNQPPKDLEDLTVSIPCAVSLRLEDLQALFDGIARPSAPDDPTPDLPKVSIAWDHQGSGGITRTQKDGTSLTYTINNATASLPVVVKAVEILSGEAHAGFGSYVSTTGSVPATQLDKLPAGVYNLTLAFEAQPDTVHDTLAVIVQELVVDPPAPDEDDEEDPTAARTIYVSTLGSNANSGFTEALPVASLAKAYSLVRDGRGDAILLNRGETFTGGFGHWAKSGESESAPLVIGAYGTGDRPIIDLTDSVGFMVNEDGQRVLSHLRVQDLDLRATRSDDDDDHAPVGIDLRPGLLVDVKIRRCSMDSLDTAARLSAANGVTISENTISNSHGPTGCAVSLDGVGDFRITRNLFLVNGRKDTSEERDPNKGNVHLVNCNAGVLSSNLFTYGAGHNLFLDGTGSGNSGLEISDNVLIGSPVQIRTTATEENAFGLRSTLIYRNVFTQAAGTLKLSSGISMLRSVGLSLASGQGVKVEQNYFIDSPAGGDSAAIRVSAQLPHENVLLDTNVIHGWGGTDAISSGITGLTLVNNHRLLSGSAYVDGSAVVGTEWADTVTDYEDVDAKVSEIADAYVLLDIPDDPEDPPAPPDGMDLVPYKGKFHFNGGRHDMTVGGWAMTPKDPRHRDDDVRAVAFVGYGSNLTIGPLTATNYRDPITVEAQPNEGTGRYDGVLIKGVHLYDNHGVTGKSLPDRSNGLYLANVDNAVIEDSIFDRNGWAGNPDDRDKYSHNIYIYAESGLVTGRRLVISRASANGAQFRSGVDLSDSLVFGNPIAGYASRNESVVRNTIFAFNRQGFGAGSSGGDCHIHYENCIFLYMDDTPYPGISEDGKGLYTNSDDSSYSMDGCITVDAGPNTGERDEGNTREGTCSLSRPEVYALCLAAATRQRSLEDVLTAIRRAVR